MTISIWLYWHTRNREMNTIYIYFIHLVFNALPIEAKHMLIKYSLKLVENILKIIKLIKLLEVAMVFKFITVQKVNFLIMTKLF